MEKMKKPKILVVDDTKTNIDILVELLKGQYQVGVAFNGTSALKYVENQRPDCILLDIMMPEMDGYEVLNRLKKQV